MGAARPRPPQPAPRSEPRRRARAHRARREAARSLHALRPGVAAERADEFFEIPAAAAGPARFRQVVVTARENLRAAAPAVCHVDGSSRPQLVDAGTDPAFHRLLTKMGEATGLPMVLQTSLNLRGEPLARSEADAVAVWDRTALDALVVDDRLYER